MNQIILAPEITGNKRLFAAHIINGDFHGLLDMEKILKDSTIPKSWFNEVFDTQGNKLVAFAIRVALQKRIPAHGNIVEHLVRRATEHGRNPFTAGTNRYTLVHVIGTYSQSNKDANIIMKILHHYQPERLQKALKTTYKGSNGTAKTPRSHARNSRGGPPGQTIAQVFNTYRNNRGNKTKTTASVNNAQNRQALLKKIENRDKRINVLSNQVEKLLRIEEQRQQEEQRQKGQSQNYTRGGTNRGGKRQAQPTWIPGRGNVPVVGVTRAPPATKNGRKKYTTKITANKKRKAGGA
jgi:hypothetical protein